MKIAVIGTGYVGLVSGTCFAETGNDVVCVDIDKEKVDKLNQKICTIYEPGIEVLLERNVDQGRLSFTTDLAKAVRSSNIVFLALPTPPGEDGSADLSYVLKAAEQIAELITEYTIIVDKSTVPIGTAERVACVMQAKTDVEFDVVSNPEFLREGMAVDDFLKPERVIIGTQSERAGKIMERLYKPYVRQGNPIIFMDERSAELTKYAANSFLATKISFMNEIANLCELTGANVDMVRHGVGTDSRIGKRFLFAGVGYGGSCFPKDVKALNKTAEENQYDFSILKAVMNVNQRQRERFVEKIIQYYQGNMQGKKAAVWGLSFKPNTDDIREAPSLFIIDKLLKEGIQIQVYDPEAMDHVKQIFGDQISYEKDMYRAAEGADFLMIATEWSVFRTPDFERLKQQLKHPVIFDGRNLYDLNNMQELGYTYISIGRTFVEQ